MMIIVSELGTKYDNPKPESVNIHPPEFSGGAEVVPVRGAN